jgi:TDG/mug DNA glycosylase family protein
VIDGRPIETLADVPPLRNRLLFVGLRPSPESVAAGHYHQDQLGRTFWSRLKTAGILPQDADPAEADDALSAAGHGITDLLKAPSDAVDAPDDRLTAGVGLLWQKVAIWRPAAVVFLYKRAASSVAGRQLTEPWGQLPGVALSGRPCFLMPDPFAPPEQVDEGLNYLRNLSAALPD